MAKAGKVFDVSIKSLIGLLVSFGIYIANDIQDDIKEMKLANSTCVENMQEDIEELQKEMVRMQTRWELMKVMPPSGELTVETMGDVEALVEVLKERNGR